MKKSQLFALVGFLLGWGAPAGGLVLKFLLGGMPIDPITFMEREWAQNPFLYWYMLLGTCLVLSIVGFFLGKSQDAEDLRNLQRVDAAVHDALTGLATRQRMHEIFAVEFKRHLDLGHPLSCLMIHLDSFQKINEGYRRLFGDTVLKDLSQLICHYVRQGDTVTRYGAEEFFCIMPGCEEKDAQEVAERIREEASKLVFPMDQAPVQLTLSIGAFTVHDAREADYRFMIEESQKNLRRAQEGGQNRTVQTVFHEKKEKTA